MAEDRYILLVTQRSGDTDEPAAADLYRGGVVARIAQLARAPSGAAKILVEGLARVRVTRYVPTGDHLRAQVVPSRSRRRRTRSMKSRRSLGAWWRSSRNTFPCTAAFRPKS